MPAMNTTAIIDATDAHTALVKVIEHFGCQAGTLHWLGASGMLELAAHHNIPAQIVQLAAKVPIGKGIAGLAAEKKEPVSICNLQTDTSGQARPEARKTGMEGSLAVPMLVDGELYGVLGIAKAEAHDWSEEEKSQLCKIANALAKKHRKS
jgi:L-methionine (R)-S-oxide reductase